MPANAHLTPCAWTIAGSDCGGGAGIQVDLKVMNAFGVHGCSVITALTAQNTTTVSLTESVSEHMLRAQLNALKLDLAPAAIKLGMLGAESTCRMLADFLPALDKPIICDPILKSTTGTLLLEPSAITLIKTELFKHVSLLTPNRPEAEIILGKPIHSVKDAAYQFLDLGVASVLIKGGHADGNECCDYWTNGTHSFWLSSPRIHTRATHGTGCILSSAITASIALGNPLSQAIILAKTFLNQCLRTPTHLGKGHSPMMILPFENALSDQPRIDA